MTGVVQQILPQTIEGYLVKMERDLGETNAQERGTGRSAWEPATIMLAGATPMDNGFPSWRLLNDGRVELRGRVALSAALANGQAVLRLNGICAPPGNGATHVAWVSTLAPCSSDGANPGVIRVDVERELVFEAATGDTVIYTKIIARPPVSQALTGWLGFDHVVFDPNLYVDILDLVPLDQFNQIYGRGVRRDDGQYIVGPTPAMGAPATPEEAPPQEYSIAFIGTGTQIVATIPGVEPPATPLASAIP